MLDLCRTKMKITIIGPGAIGLLLASSLEELNDVSILVKKKHYDTLNKKGLWIKKGKNKRKIKANIITEMGDSEVVIIAVKSYDLQETTKILRTFEGKIIICQNGLEMLDYNPRNSNDILAIVTSVGAVSLELGITEFMGTGNTVIGNLNGTDNRTWNLENIFTEKYFRILPVKNIIKHIWLKATINSAINPIASFYSLRNGRLSEEKYWNLVEELLKESMKIAKANNIEFPESPLEAAKMIVDKTPNNLCSMLQDLKKGQRTEIEEINGIIIKIGKMNNLKTTVNSKYLNKIKSIS